MKLLRNATIALATLTAATTASAEYLYGFGNVSINRLDWTNKTEKNTAHKDFTYLEAEGGAGFTWGEVYGFFDLENPHKSSKDGRRLATKANTRINLGETGFNLFAQVYDLRTHDFDEQNRFVGFGYNFTGDNYFFKPTLSLHHAETTYFKGNNGYMLGWVAGYNFKAMGEDFMITNWHEYEFGRNSNYLRSASGNSKKSGHNGGLALWWNATDSITAGLQYRYADDKLGNATYQDGIIYSLKYNF
ncbi:ion channel protein Tsx [Endozoicomonas montiporae]|uniref:Ion channel protein Tsx n=2 Tax=Endozoicomonas montiporae TaxID=1027273 RepID=A0A081N0V4_9GAMM|nr:outer membrane protein OmpK [Endozoicomonas montiporae]AMO54560.1 hypothetical protein EZMO1_0296 [Endozoicomonas montiporae CL-33]KEQ12077.1 ion channel protein Tsx [Endozoicomonas montiporae]